MANCHRRVSNAACKSCSGFNNAGWRHRSASASLPPNLIRKRNEKFTVVYLVRSFRTYARIRSLTTGTFNLVVKDRIAFRLSGAPSVQANPLLERIRLSSKLFNHIVRAKPCQPAHSTAFPRDFHMRNSARNAAQGSSINLEALTSILNPCHSERPFREESAFWGSSTARNDIAFRSGFAKTPIYSAHAEAEDRKLRKDPSWRSLL